MVDELTAGEAVSEPTVVAINETLTSERLDRYLTTQLPHISRGGIQRLLREGNILVDSKPATRELVKTLPLQRIASSQRNFLTGPHTFIALSFGPSPHLSVRLRTKRDESVSS